MTREQMHFDFVRTLDRLVEKFGPEMTIGTVRDVLARSEEHSQCRYCGEEIVKPASGMRWVHDDGLIKCSERDAPATPIEQAEERQ